MPVDRGVELAPPARAFRETHRHDRLQLRLLIANGFVTHLNSAQQSDCAEVLQDANNAAQQNSTKTMTLLGGPVQRADARRTACNGPDIGTDGSREP